MNFRKYSFANLSICREENYFSKKSMTYLAINEGFGYSVQVSESIKLKM